MGFGNDFEACSVLNLSNSSLDFDKKASFEDSWDCSSAIYQTELGLFGLIFFSRL